MPNLPSPADEDADPESDAPAVTTDTGPFAIVPQWVLDRLAAMGATDALSVYVALHRWIDNRSREGHPTRRTLADVLRCSPDSVDRRIKQLEAAGAVIVRRRRRPDLSYASSTYFLPRADPSANMPTPAAPKRSGATANVRSLDLDPEETRGKALSSHSSQTKKSKSASEERECEFEDWWASYPRKVAKAKARTTYLARRKAGVTAETLTEALRRYVEQLRKDGTEDRYVLHGSTFLGPEGRWADLSADPVPDSGSGPGSPQTATQAPLSANGEDREPTIDEQADEMLAKWRAWRKRRFAMESGEMWDEAAAAAREAFRSALEAGHSREVVSRAMIALVEAHAVEWGTTGVTRLGPDAEALAAHLAGHAPREAVG